MFLIIFWNISKIYVKHLEESPREKYNIRDCDCENLCQSFERLRKFMLG